MIKKIKIKLYSKTGESIGETLISLLIAALALVMLAGAISAASGTIQKSKNKLNDYYSANEQSSGVIIMSSGGTPGNIIIKDSTNAISEQSCSVTYYKNNEFGKKTVVAYIDSGS